MKKIILITAKTIVGIITAPFFILGAFVGLLLLGIGKGFEFIIDRFGY